jgi:transposase
MKKVTTIGLDIAKNVFQVHGVDEGGEVIVDRRLRRSDVVKFFRKLPPCVVGLEACATAHHWGREIAALGHDVRLMPPTRVKAYVKRGGKNDRADAAACCEAVTRPSMRFVPLKTVEQQSALMLHRGRQLLVTQRTRLCNAIRAHLAEFGLAAAKGDAGFTALLAMISNVEDERLPATVRPVLTALATQFRAADEQIDGLDRQIIAWHKANGDSLRVATIPQIGPIIASALVATAGDAKRFDNGRQFAAWLGLVPRQNSTGGKQRLGSITKAGDKYMRQLLVIAATGMISRVRANPAVSPWFADLLARKSPRQATVALANKMARIAWAILAKGGTYQAPMSANTAEAA